MSNGIEQRKDGGREFPITWIRKNGVEEIGVRLSEYRGYHLIDVRIYSFIEGEFRPTKKGFALRVDAIEELVSAIEWARQHAENLGWLDEFYVPAPEHVSAAQEAIGRARAASGPAKRRGSQ